MEIKGKVLKVLPAQTGQGRNGEWKKQSFVIELEGSGSFTRKLCFQVWNDKVNFGALVPGAMVNVFFDPESREFQEKWYTDLTAWRVDTDATAVNLPSEPRPLPPPESFPPEPSFGMDEPPANDDLPF